MFTARSQPEGISSEGLQVFQQVCCCRLKADTFLWRKFCIVSLNRQTVADKNEYKHAAFSDMKIKFEVSFAVRIGMSC